MRKKKLMSSSWTIKDLTSDACSPDEAIQTSSDPVDELIPTTSAQVDKPIPNTPAPVDELIPTTSAPVGELFRLPPRQLMS